MSTSRRVLSALTALSLTAVPLATAVAAGPSTSVVVNGVRYRRAERHPEIRKAIAQLQRARNDLQDAAHDFGGHRADALAATDNAIRQLQIALQYDK